MSFTSINQVSTFVAVWRFSNQQTDTISLINDER